MNSGSVCGMVTGSLVRVVSPVGVIVLYGWNSSIFVDMIDIPG